MKFLFVLIFVFNLIYADSYSSATSKINSIRKSSGLKPLGFNMILRRAAYKHARYLASNRSHTHNEIRGKREFSGVTPSDRIVKAGYKSRVVVENISFGQKSYSASIDNLMATVYHRLAFLDLRVDEIGAGRAGRRESVFVYDMSSSVVANLCKSAKSISKAKEYIYRVCANPKIKIDKRLFNHKLYLFQRRHKSIICYPYPSQKGVPTKYVHEVPDPISSGYKAGYPVTVELNPAYYSSAKIKRFRLYDSSGKRVASFVITSSNDRHHKLHSNVFVLIPKKRLKPNSIYMVDFVANDGYKNISKRWQFRTGRY